VLRFSVDGSARLVVVVLCVVQCASAGRSVLALSVLSFVLLSGVLVLLVSRVARRPLHVPLCGLPRAESVALGVSCFLMWIVMVVWRTQCMSTQMDWTINKESSVDATGVCTPFTHYSLTHSFPRLV
jgi:hypothetical protein